MLICSIWRIIEVYLLMPFPHNLTLYCIVLSCTLSTTLGVKWCLINKVNYYFVTNQENIFKLQNLCQIHLLFYDNKICLNYITTAINWNRGHSSFTFRVLVIFQLLLSYEEQQLNPYFYWFVFHAHSHPYPLVVEYDKKIYIYTKKSFSKKHSISFLLTLHSAFFCHQYHLVPEENKIIDQ